MDDFPIDDETLRELLVRGGTTTITVRLAFNGPNGLVTHEAKAIAETPLVPGREAAESNVNAFLALIKKNLESADQLARSGLGVEEWSLPDPLKDI